MSQPNLVWEQLRPYLSAFRTQYRLWVIPTMVCATLAFGYALVMPRHWRASQAYLVRDEAIGNSQRPGQFDSIDRMKVFQETIVEVARNPVVVADVLTKLGPPEDHAEGKPWPTPSAIESLQASISVAAPKGAEFGRTEIFVLSVLGKSPEQAMSRIHVLSTSLEKHLAELREARAQSIIREQEKTLQMAQGELDDAIGQLEAMEREVGPDLGELRVLNEIGAGDSNLRRSWNEIDAELRRVESSRESLKQLHGLLVSSQKNPDTLLATPSRLLEAQPALKQLKEGLIQAQLRCAELQGRLSENHPTVISAVRTEEQIRQRLNAEIATALTGVEADLQANQAQIEQLQSQQQEMKMRLDRLARLRARYSNQVSEVKRRTEIVDRVKKDLSDAHATSGASAASSLLTRFQDPVAGDRPVGPGKKLILAAGLGGGLSLGAGLVFLFMPIGPNGTGRRWNDYVNAGRRATDRFFGRRAGDRSPNAPNGLPVGSALMPMLGRRLSDPTNTTPVVGGRREHDIPAINTRPTETAVEPGERRRSEVDRRRNDGRRARDQEDGETKKA